VIAVIPAAGRGTSLLPLTKSQPKEMLPVGNKPVVQHVVEELLHNGLRRILFITGSDKTAIENHFDINPELIQFLRYNGKEDILADLAFEREEADYYFTRQRQQSGLGNAVLCAESFVGNEPFAVALGDTILGLEMPSNIVRKMTECFEQASGKVSAIIAFDEVPPEDVVNYGIAKPKNGGGDFFELEDLIEKPSLEKAPSHLAVAARYVFSPEIFHYLHKTPRGIGDAVQLTDAIRLMIQDGKTVLGVCLPQDEPRYDIGDFDSYYRAFLDFILHHPQRRESLKKILG
jgi:UTP--glucose-1-phosphate uridylyltransferase